jgi:prepilin-type N-terminal cleavage/methylation domain-containing protein
LPQVPEVSSRSGRGRRSRPRPAHGNGDGYSLLEVIFVAALIAIIAAMAIPQTLVTVDRSRARAAARYLSSRMAFARTQAVGRGAAVALRFENSPSGIVFSAFADGNQNGVRSRDIAAGIDVALAGPVLLADLFPGVAIALAADGSGDPVQLGGSDLLSFTATGTATSGTVYIRGRDGSQFAVRVLGATGRCRVLRYDEPQHDWVEML